MNRRVPACTPTLGTRLEVHEPCRVLVGTALGGDNDVLAARGAVDQAGAARAATTSDAFNAIAEPQRRDMPGAAAGERPVTDWPKKLGMSQAGRPKHLRVLREVGLVRVRGAGKQRLYGLDARGLDRSHEWVGGSSGSGTRVRPVGHDACRT